MGQIIRLSEFHIALTDGQFPVRWSKNLFFGFGYPFFNFNYPLVYYFGEFFHILIKKSWLLVIYYFGLILGGFFFFATQKFFKKGVVFLFLILLTSFGLTEQRTNKMWQPNEYVQVPALTDIPIAGTTTWANEQAPIWLTPAPLDIPLSKLDVLAGQAEISQLTWKSNVHRYQVTAGNDSILAENTAYYPGWQVFVNKRETPIFYQGVLGRGRITFLVPKGVNEVRVVFGETITRKIADLTSLGTLLILIFFFFRWQVKFRRTGN